jgi:hypothetical protein
LHSLMCGLREVRFHLIDRLLREVVLSVVHLF